MVDISSASFNYRAGNSCRRGSRCTDSVHRVIARTLRDCPLRAEIEAAKALVYPLANENAVSNLPLLLSLLESVDVPDSHCGALIRRQRRAETIQPCALVLDHDAVTLH